MNGDTMQGGGMPSSLCVPFRAIPTASQETQGEGFFCVRDSDAGASTQREHEDAQESSLRNVDDLLAVTLLWLRKRQRANGIQQHNVSSDKSQNRASQDKDRHDDAGGSE